MKNKIFLFLALINSTLFSQINFFNLYKPYQTSLCTLPNVYGLQLQMNYIVVNINSAEFQVPIDVYWGVLENLEVGLQAAGISRTIGDKVEKGMSDMCVGAKYNLLEENKKNLSSRPTISTELGIGFPTGDYKRNFSTGGFFGVIMWLFEKQIVMRTGHYFNLILNLGFKYNTKNQDDYRVGESFFYNFGSYFELNEKLEFSFGVKGINKSVDEFKGVKVFNTEKFKTYLYSGLTYNIDQYRKFFAAVLSGITEDSENLIFNIGMMY
ncbi:MAG: transporter [Endomicrobia bacterium]|nr:transporter [Endomicrobiia bacterium]